MKGPVEVSFFGANEIQLIHHHYYCAEGTIKGLHFLGTNNTRMKKIQSYSADNVREAVAQSEIRQRNKWRSTISTTHAHS